MEPHYNPLQDLTWGNINDAVCRLRIENPDLDAESLPLSELLRISKRNHPYRSRTVHNSVQTKPSQVSYGEEENDGDDEYEDDAEETHLQAAPPLPLPRLSKPLPPSPKPDSPTSPEESHDSNHHASTLLQKGSDGLRGTPNPPCPHYNSIFGGPSLSTVHAQIKASIPSHTTAQIKLLRQRKLNRVASKKKAKRNCAAPKRHPSPHTPSTKGSPRPWPISPHTPTDNNKSFPPHPANTPFSRLTLDALRTQSASPQRSRTLLRKQKARLSAPLQDLDAYTPVVLSPDGGVESGAERGRTRLQKEKPASRNDHYEPSKGKEGLKIGRPMLQHPIMIPVVSLEVASELVSPGKGRGSPLVEEQRVSEEESGVGGVKIQKGGVGGHDEGGVGVDAGKTAEGDVGTREKRHAVLVEGCGAGRGYFGFGDGELIGWEEATEGWAME